MNHDDSKLELNFKEKRQSFALMIKGGLGLRDWFWEDEMIKNNIMTKDQATKNGYVRVADFKTCISHIESNMAVFAHATSELKPTKKVFSYKSVLLANFAFVLRVILYHITLVAFCNSGLMQVGSLILIESCYIFLIVKNFILLRYLVSIHMFFSKMSQSLFLLFFHVITFMVILKNGPNSNKTPTKSQ
jgi:hypothetical protein